MSVTVASEDAAYEDAAYGQVAPAADTPTLSGWGPGWDLTLIAADVEEVEARLARLSEQAQDFAARYQGRVASSDAPSLKVLLDELGDLKEELRVLAAYSELRLAAQVDDPEAKDLAIVLERRRTVVENTWRFFQLEWARLDEAQAEQLLADGALRPYRHYLANERQRAGHLLSADGERVFAERSAAAQVAWQELYQEQIGAIAAVFDGGDGSEPHSLDRLLSYATDPDRSRRHGAARTLYQELEGRAPVLAAAYDALVCDRLAEDRLRGYASPMAKTDLENKLPSAVVEAMLTACAEHEQIARRWFGAKSALLGHRLEFHDVFAPLGRQPEPISYRAAQTLVLDQFERFDPQLAESAAGFFAGRVDAEPRLAKAGGACCVELSRAVKPFVLMNYSDRLEDVVTLAHELGHGVQFQLTAQAQPPLVTGVGLALAEVSSTFAEMIVFDGLLARESDPAVRLHLLSGNVEKAFSTIFRQAAMCRFERAAYAARQSGKSLRPERLSELWLGEQYAYLGEVVDLPDWSRWGWAYISHFVSTRFYTYAYSFAHLVALALFDCHRQDPTFAARYLDFLAVGGAEDPVAQLQELGVDVTAAAVWERAFAELDRRVEQAVALAQSLA